MKSRTRRLAPLLGVLALLAVVVALEAPWRGAGQRPDDKMRRLHEGMTGHELIRSLLDRRCMPYAHHELCRRGDNTTPASFAEFEKKHRDPEVIVCPQRDGKRPIYVVLSDFLSHHYDDSGYMPSRPNELFAEADDRSNRKDLRIEVFSADGEMLNPFENNDNVLDGIIADVNADGLVERVARLPVGGPGAQSADVLFVEIMAEKAERVLAVVYNWGSTDDWDFAVSDRDGDGILEIDLGPLTNEGLLPRVTWHWDWLSEEWVGSGSVGPHYRVIDPKRLWPEISRLSKEEVAFEKDPDAMSRQDRERVRDGLAPSPASGRAPSSAYIYESLKNLSDSEILRFMADPEYDDPPIAQSTKLPEDFWSLSAREAAESFAEANRSDSHKKRFQFALDSRSSAVPPAASSLSLSYTSAPCYGTVNHNLHLRVEPAGSALITAQSHEPSVLGWLLHGETAEYHFGVWEVGYEDARKISDTIWWLRRGRTWPPGEPVGTSVSSADGTSTLQFIGPDGTRQIVVTGTSRAGTIPERWAGMYGDEDFLQCAEYLLHVALMERLDGAESGGWFYHDESDEKSSVPFGDPDGFAKQRALVGRILSAYTADDRLLSSPIAIEASRAAGDWLVHESDAELRRIDSFLSGLPRPDERARQEEIERLRAQTRRELGEGTPDRSAIRHMSRRLKEAVAGLFRRELDVTHGLDLAACRTSLKRAVTKSLGSLRADNAVSLAAQARTRSQAACWAMRELSRKDKEAYREALESWVEKGIGAERERAIAAFAELDSKRAEDLRRRYASEIDRDAELDSYQVVREAEVIQDETERVERLLEIAEDEDEYHAVRGVAIEALVPDDEPFLYQHEDLDEMLVRLSDIGKADMMSRGVRSAAARALARRTGCTRFDATLGRYDPTDFTGGREGFGVLTNIAMGGGAECRVKMLAYLREQFVSSALPVEDILFAAWCLEMRDVKPEIERLATSAPGVRQGELLNTWSSQPHEIEGRYDLARRIAALWNEEDRVTRSKLLIAFCSSDGVEGSRFMGNPERRRHAIEALRKEIAGMSEEEAAEAAEFAELCVSSNGSQRLELSEIFAAAFGNGGGLGADRE